MNLTVKNRIVLGETVLVIGDNADYTAHFTFDSEWDDKIKTARFENEKLNVFKDVLLDNDSCTIPIEVLKSGFVKVGVFTSTMTTNYWKFYVNASIKDDNGSPVVPTPDIYSQIVSMIQELSENGVTDEQLATAIENYLTEHPIESLDEDDVIALLTAYIQEHRDELKGADGTNGNNGTNGQDGRDGVDGQDGADGFSPTVSITDIYGGKRITITDANGNHPFDILNGAKGEDGEKGETGASGADGYSPTVTVTNISGGKRVTITDKNGSHPFDILNGTKGDDGYSPTVTITNITNGKRITITDVNGDHPFDIYNGTGGSEVSPEDIASAVANYFVDHPIDLSEVITDKSLKFIESNDFRLVNSLQAIIADIDNFNKVMYMGNYPYINKYDISTDSPTLVKSIFYENFGFASTATNNGKAMSFLARNCVIIGDYIYYGVRNSSGQNMDLSENACNGGIVILRKSDFTVVGHLALPHLVTWVTKYSRNGIDYIFANLRTEGFKLYEVTTNPLVPTLVYDGSLPHDSAATNEHQAGYIVNIPSGKTLYVAMGFANAIFFYDIDDLSNIVLLKKITVGTASNRDVNVGHTYSAYVNYPYMYCTAASSLSLAYKTSGLFRLDISDIENGNVGIKMHLVDESLSSQISAGDMQPSYVERWGNHLLVPANEKGIYVYRLLDDGDIKYESTWVIDSKRVKSEGYDTKPCKIFHCKSDYLGRLFVPESDIMNQSDVSVMQNGREPYRRCHIYKLINRIV